MNFFLMAALLLLHTCWWGAGLASALTPHRWRAFWPVFMPVCGFSLQSAVVWAGVMADLPGTRSYAGWTELLPAALLLWQVRRRGARALVRAGARTAAVWVLVFVVLALLIRPMALAAHDLTTLSIGSCDAADYAGGARLMLEFERSDRSGFLGLTEVVQLHSVDNFFDHFVRLNHFTPSALVAHQAAVFGRAPYELVGIATAVLLAASLPLVFWLARATLRLRTRAALFVAAIYGLTPVTWYAVFHVAMGQLLAAQAVTLLTIAGVAMWRRPAGGWSGLLVVAYGLVFGAYTFIVFVALVPAVTFAGGQALAGGRGRALVRWLLAITLPALAAGLYFALRIDGLLERLLLFQEHDFGWKIKALTPEGWVGLVRGPELQPLTGWLRWPLAALLVVAVVTALRRPGGGRQWLGCALTVPVLLGYGYLQVRGAVLGTNASYDAYKLLSVFYPGILAVACVWFGSGFRSRWGPTGALALAGVVLIGNLANVRAFTQKVRGTPLIVDASLATLEQIEARPEVGSINLRMEDMWSRLWANAFLLRRPHYFRHYTYEGRRNTEMKGGWDLTSGIVRVRPAGGAAAGDWVPLPEPYQLIRRGGVLDLRAEAGQGWFDLERLPGRNERWRWTTAGAELIVENPSPSPKVARIVVDARSVVPRELTLSVSNREAGSVALGVTRSVREFPALTLPPGRSTLRLNSPTPAVAPGSGDARLLLACVYRIELRVEPAGLPLPAGPDARENPSR